jgi:hypothetical protein
MSCFFFRKQVCIVFFLYKIPIGFLFDKTICFDITKLNTAGSMSDEGANLLAEANGSKLKGNERKVDRDRAYTHLKEVVDEV